MQLCFHHRLALSTRFAATSILAVAASLALPGGSSAQRISADGDPSGGSCYLPVVTGPGSGTFYIVARLGGSVTGITGAEFRVTGMPPEFIVNTHANLLANVTLGDPFGAGCNIAFPSCQMGSGGAVVLYTVDFTVLSSGFTPFALQVGGHTTPFNPQFQCPNVTLCDANFTRVCVTGGQSAPGPVLPVPSSPVPADGAGGVPVDVHLAWSATGFQSCCGIGTPFTNVYFGTTSPPPLVLADDEILLSYDPGPLAENTTYYWRIVMSPDHDCGEASGPIWSFTTGVPVAAEPTTWATVKEMFR